MSTTIVTGGNGLALEAFGRVNLRHALHPARFGIRAAGAELLLLVCSAVIVRSAWLHQRKSGAAMRGNPIGGAG
jgi:hypothetical protein